MSYNRRFIILNKFDEKFCMEGATGYCKIDSGEEKSRITVFVQGLRDFGAKTDSSIYLVNSSKGQVISAFLGNIVLQKGTGEFSIEVDTQNVCGVGLSVSQFDLVAVCVKDKKDIEQCEVSLVGYYNAPLDKSWKNYFVGSLRSKNDAEEIIKAKIEDKPQIHDEPVEPAKQESKPKSNYENNYAQFWQKGCIKEINDVLSEVRGVEEYNPFEKVKLKYKWWKVANESFLENIFKFNVASSQVFKHPLIKKLLRQTNHCLFGIVSDTDEKTRFIAFGFAAEYSMKDQLYIGGFASFYPSVGYNKRKGDRGYWVVHIRMDDGSISMTV